MFRIASVVPAQRLALSCRKAHTMSSGGVWAKSLPSLAPSANQSSAGSSSIRSASPILAATSMSRRWLRSFPTTFDLPDPSSGTSSSNKTNNNLPMVKIVATIGPKSEQLEPLVACVEAGLNCMRLNFSHATTDEVELRCANLKTAVARVTPTLSSSPLPTQDVVSILLDTKGPELRTGKLAHDESGTDTVELVAGASITLHSTVETLPNVKGSTETDLYIDFKVLAQVLQPNRLVLLDDGAIILTVLSTNISKGTVECRVQNTGSLRSRAGVNLPLAETAQHLPALSSKDQADITYGMQAADIDFVAASFVQSAQHVIDIRQHIMNTANQMDEWKHGRRPLPWIISKIETASALVNFDEILEVSDGIMVARGDLGVEIPLHQVTNAQKEMVAACNAAGKPVIVATQMLESMTKAPRPTRAEVSDVTNAVYDGADCVMLSGETAKGSYPAGTIQFMREIVVASERYAATWETNNSTSGGLFSVARPQGFTDSPKTAVSAVAKAAVTASLEDVACKAIVVALSPVASFDVPQNANQAAIPTLPGLIAAHRPLVPIVILCHSAKQARQLQIYRGIHPVLVSSNKTLTDHMDDAKAVGLVASGDSVVLVTEAAAGGNTGAAAGGGSMQIVEVA